MSESTKRLTNSLCRGYTDDSCYRAGNKNEYVRGVVNYRPNRLGTLRSRSHDDVRTAFLMQKNIEKNVK